jgi:hypothetical protein
VSTEQAEEAGEALFGTFDGLTSVIGVIVGLLASSATIVQHAGFGLAAASTGGMAAGQYLKDRSEQVSLGRAVRHAGVMGGATCVGTVLPLIPFLFAPVHPAAVASGFVVAAVAIAIAWFRARTAQSKVEAYIETLVILGVVTLLSVVTSLATGSS